MHFLKLVNSSADAAPSPKKGDEISPSFSQYLLCTVSTVWDSFFTAHNVFHQIPHLPTEVLLHSDKQSGCGCFGSRSSPSKCSLLSFLRVLLLFACFRTCFF